MTRMRRGNENGVTTVEWAFLVALCVLVLAGALDLLFDGMQAAFEGQRQTIED